MGFEPDLVTPGEAKVIEESFKKKMAWQGPPQPKYNLADYNPEGTAYWTIPMVLTWIATGDYDAVRELRDELRAQHFKYGPVSYDHETELRDEYGSLRFASTFIQEKASSGDNLCSFNEADKDLRGRLPDPSGKRIVVSAKSASSRKREKIDADEWADETASDKLNWRDEDGCIWLGFGTGSEFRRAYKGPIILRSKILEIWPAPKVQLKGGTQVDAAEFAQWTSAFAAQNDGELPTIEDGVTEFAKPRGLKRRWVLEQRERLPPELKRARGQKKKA